MVNPNNFPRRNVNAARGPLLSCSRGRMALIAVVLLSAPIYAGLTFVPDSTFQGFEPCGMALAWRRLVECSSGRDCRNGETRRQRRLALPESVLPRRWFSRFIPLHRRLQSWSADSRRRRRPMASKGSMCHSMKRTCRRSE